MYGDLTRARWITDLSTAAPAAALATERRRGAWQVVAWAADGRTGRLLSAGPETRPPPVRIPLHARGWHAVSVGAWAPRWSAPYGLTLRLGGQARPVRFQPETHANLTLLERFWSYAELAEEDTLEVAPLAPDVSAALAFVKLVPLDAAEIAAVCAERARRDTRRLIAMNDGFTDFHMHDPGTAAELEGWLEPYRHTDVGKIFFCLGAGGDVVSYPSRLGKRLGAGGAAREASPSEGRSPLMEDFPRVGDRRAAEALARLHARGIDPLRVVCDYAHELGRELHVSLRMGAFACVAPFDELFTGYAFARHPEWHCVDRDGAPVMRLSYAHAGVRRLALDLLQEGMARGADGVNLIFNRGGPFSLYEEPLVASFRAAHGADPRQIAEDDPRWVAHRAEVMTGFLRELRRALPGTPVTAHVLHTAAENRAFGLDPAAWAREGLVTALVAYPFRQNTSEVIDAAWFATLGIPWYAELFPRRLAPKAALAQARRFHEAGASGLCLWDTNLRDPYFEEWALVRQLGHCWGAPAEQEELARLAADTGARELPLTSLGGFRVDRYPPHWAY